MGIPGLRIGIILYLCRFYANIFLPIEDTGRLCLDRRQVFGKNVSKKVISLLDGLRLVILLINRLNEHYRRCHELCRFLLHSPGTRVLFFRKEKGFFTLLIDMNILFERLVARLVETYLLPGWFLKVQYKKSDAITWEDGKSYRDIKPYILLVDPNGTHRIIDTKYKLYNEKKIDTSDIFQLAYYVQSFLAKDEEGFYWPVLFILM